jgi:hypothetical protein
METATIETLIRLLEDKYDYLATKTDIAGLRTGIVGLRTEIAKGESRLTRWIATWTVGSMVVMTGLVTALIKLL